MKFLLPAQTISEAKFRKFPVYEVLAATATALGASAAVAGVAGAVGTAAIGAGVTYGASKLSGGGKGGGGGSAPAFNPQQSLDYGLQAYTQAAQEGLQFSKKGTKANIANQNLVTPGSSQQRQLAQDQINAYIQGQIPQDVQQQINRQVAQNLGGGYNMFTGGGQAPQNFARNIGQTSLGLSQFGLSAAPTWQQLANSMVTKPEVGFYGGLQALGVGNDVNQSQYQSQFNQYQASQLQNQQDQQLLMQGGKLGLQGYDAYNKSNYYNNLSQTGQGYQSTMGGIPSAMGYTPTQYSQGWGTSVGEY